MFTAESSVAIAACACSVERLLHRVAVVWSFACLFALLDVFVSDMFGIYTAHETHRGVDILKRQQVQTFQVVAEMVKLSDLFSDMFLECQRTVRIQSDIMLVKHCLGFFEGISSVSTCSALRCNSQ